MLNSLHGSVSSKILAFLHHKQDHFTFHIFPFQLEEGAAEKERVATKTPWCQVVETHYMLITNLIKDKLNKEEEKD